MLLLDFVSFAQRAFRELSPRGAFLMSWHIETVAAKLTTLRRGEIRRVIINKTYLPNIIEFISQPAGCGWPPCVSRWHWHRKPYRQPWRL